MKLFFIEFDCEPLTAMHQDPDPYNRFLMGADDDDDDDAYYGTAWEKYFDKVVKPQRDAQKKQKEAKASSSKNNYPHTCPHCGAPAYIGGMNTVDCSKCDGTGGNKKKCSCGGNCGDNCKCDKDKCGSKKDCDGCQSC